jgi:protein SCO1/2
MTIVRWGALALALLAGTAALGQTMSLDVPDVAVRDQNGAPLHFYSDLVRGKTVVMNFVFTSCTTICSPMGANFGALQTLLGDDVRLISVTIDPGTDTPQRLLEWSRRFKATPRWTLVTGKPADIERLLKAMGVWSADRFRHTPIVLAGDGRTNRWTRGNGLAPPADIAAMVGRVHPKTTPAGEAARR